MPYKNQQDATRVQRPVIYSQIQYKPKDGEYYIQFKGKKILVKPKNETISQDNRSSYQKRQDDQSSKIKKKQIQESKQKEQSQQVASALLKSAMPSTYIGPIFNQNDKSYIENVWNQEGSGDATTDLALDVISPVGLTGVKAAFGLPRHIKSTIDRMNFFYRPNGLNTVNTLFRNSEWSNFLTTRNGNNYYRLQRKPGLVSDNVRKDNEGYFISHTTPWEEFSGLGSSEPNGMKVLYEFPEDVFGKLPASNSKGIYGPDDVSELGKLHLLYGNTSSGKRDLVRTMTDEQARTLDTSASIIGIKDRPKSSYGLYNTDPIYERISQGNQTVISPQTLNNALQNTSYNMFQYSPQGIIKSIYVPKPYNYGTKQLDASKVYDRRTGKEFNIDDLDFENNVYFTHGTSDQGMESILKEGMTNTTAGVDLTGTVLIGNKQSILNRISEMPTSRYSNIAILQYPKRAGYRGKITSETANDPYLEFIQPDLRLNPEFVSHALTLNPKASIIPRQFTIPKYRDAVAGEIFPTINNGLHLPKFGDTVAKYIVFKDRNGGKMSNLELIGFYKYGGIHIKKENEGKFTKSAKAAGKSVQEHARDVVNNSKSTELQRKRAQFALNAKKWKH